MAAPTWAGNVSVAAGIQSWTVPTTGTYRITAVGGRGAAGDEGREGGRGAELSGDFTLTAGATLRIAVGQQGRRGVDTSAAATAAAAAAAASW